MRICSRREEKYDHGSNGKKLCVGRFSVLQRNRRDAVSCLCRIVHLLYVHLVSFTFIVLVVLFSLLKFSVIVFYLSVHRIISGPNFCIILNHKKITSRFSNSRWVTSFHYKAKFFVSKDQGYCIIFSQVTYRTRFTNEKKKSSKNKERNKGVEIKEVTTPNQHLGGTGTATDKHCPAEHGETVCRSNRIVTSNAWRNKHCWDHRLLMKYVHHAENLSDSDQIFAFREYK